MNPTLALYGWSVDSTASPVSEAPPASVGALPSIGTFWNWVPPDSAFVTPDSVSPGPITASFMTTSPTTFAGPNVAPLSVDVKARTARKPGMSPP